MEFKTLNHYEQEIIPEILKYLCKQIENPAVNWLNNFHFLHKFTDQTKQFSKF